MFSLWLSQLLDRIIMLGLAVWLHNSLKRSSEFDDYPLDRIGMTCLYIAIITQFIPAIQHLIEYWPY